MSLFSPQNNPLRGIEVKGGVSHLHLSEPAYGKIIIAFDLDTHLLHLAGEVRKDLLKQMPQPFSNTTEDIFLSVQLGMRKFPFYHKDIKPPGLQNSCIVGGAAAYFDSEQLFIDDFSTEFGSITEKAVKLCLKESECKVLLGRSVAKGEELFAQKGLINLAGALRR